MEDLNMNRYKLYTGPTLVNGVAARLSASPLLSDVLAGTEHVHLSTYLGPEAVLDLVRAPYGTGFTHRDLQLLSTSWTPESARQRVGGTFGS